MRRALVINSSQTQACGVYQHAKRMGQILCRTPSVDNIAFEYYELNSPQELEPLLQTEPDVVFYNYYPGPVLGFLPDMNLKGRFPRTKHVYMVHEFVPGMVNGPLPWGTEHVFDAVVCTDPSVKSQVNNSTWFATVRPVPSMLPVDLQLHTDRVLRVGSFGFSFNNKGFDRVMLATYQAQMREFENVEFHFHITDATFTGGYMAVQAHSDVLHLVNKLNSEWGVEYKYIGTSEFLDTDEIVQRLSQNSVNALAYDYNHGRGVSSAVDFLVAAGKPFTLLTESEQFRHVKHPNFFPDTPHKLQTLAERTQDLQNQWSWDTFIADYVHIVNNLTPKI